MVVMCPICGKRGYLLRGSKNYFRVKHYLYVPNGKKFALGQNMRMPYHNNKNCNDRKDLSYYDKKDTYCRVTAEWALLHLDKH
jgi:hypothetical protein